MARTTTPARRPGPHGWRGRGGGASTYVQAPAEWRGTSVQVCGLWPFAAGSGAPVVGVPLGHHLHTGATVGCDPISWFERGNLINNPSAFVMGLPAYGKSTLVRRMVLGLTGYGVMPLVLGDLKPDYVDLVEALGGQVVRYGPGRAKINVLDPGEAHAAAARLTGQARVEVLADAHQRRLEMVVALSNIWRKRPPESISVQILDRALHVLDDTADRVPVLGDLLNVIQDGPESVRAVAVDRGDKNRYQEITRDIEVDLVGFTSGAAFGDMFSGHTTTPLHLDRPAVFDVSSLGEAQADVKAAALLSCWSYGFGAVNIANALADAGLQPQRHYFIVMDELWQALRAGEGMVDRVDALTRLNRQKGVGQVMISHTMSDLAALPELDQKKARGFVERSGMVILGALPEDEMPKLSGAVKLARAEQDLLTSWTTPTSWGSSADAEASPPPGRGKFLIKVGGRPGIPLNVALTSVEQGLHNTNKRWNLGRRPA